MDLDFLPEHAEFRKEVRDWIAANYPAETRRKQEAGEHLGKEDILAWHRILHNKGWLTPSWPVEYGGTGWDSVRKYIFSEELARAQTSQTSFGLGMIGPVLYTFATPEQKEKFLPGTMNGDIWWCQGYSEPGAGSDLAGLSTRAVRDGDHYIVNGQKTWTTQGHFADWGFFLVRTDPDAKKQEGISFLLIDMKSPGITVRPIITIEGGHEVNDVFLDNVRVPVANLIGEENKGWTVAKYLLGHERTGIAGVARSKRGIERLRELAAGELADDAQPLINDSDFRRKVAELEVDLAALEYTELRSLASESKGKGPGPEASLLKVKGTEVGQRLTELTLEAAAHYGAPYARGMGGNIGPIGPDYAGKAAPTYFNMRKTSIFGGSNEIQRNIIAKAVLGL
ncbi:MAG: acyl-CoA dehydrogenase family protein [Caulobacterales bacterium]|nr:acyl-CoA dehydrogenase family protein [Caulobacterales bacterium]